MGSDAVGLVGSITAPISQAGGNIVDLRQDVLHGLFTIFLVVDLAETEMRIEDLTDMVGKIGEDTGLELSVDNYNPTPRDPEKKNVLLILVGNDRPGIISSISETLGKYRANIEFAQSIGREGVFLTELLTDISHSSIPLENLRATVRKAMADVGIQAVFQSEDVFNKKKRVILFDIGVSFIGPEMRDEILRTDRTLTRRPGGRILDKPHSRLAAEGCRPARRVPVRGAREHRAAASNPRPARSSCCRRSERWVTRSHLPRTALRR